MKRKFKNLILQRVSPTSTESYKKSNYFTFIIYSIIIFFVISLLFSLMMGDEDSVEEGSNVENIGSE